MNPLRRALPVLTEVVEIEAEADSSAAAQPLPLSPESVALEDVEAAIVSDQALVNHVLHVLRPRIDALLDGYLHSALAPQLSRLVEDALLDAQGELARRLPMLMAQAVDEALAQRRKP
jgi:hypothetical protein